MDSLGCELAMWTPNWFPIWCTYMYSESFVIKFIDILFQKNHGRDIILVQISFTLTNTCRHLIIPRKHNQVQATVMAIICITFLKELHGFINSSTQPFREIVLLYQRDRQEYLYGSKLIMQKFSQAYAIWFVPPQKNQFYKLQCGWNLTPACNLSTLIFYLSYIVIGDMIQVKAARGRKYCVYRDNKD